MQESLSFKTKSLRSRVFDYLKKKPDANIYELYFEFKDANKKSVKRYKYEFKILFDSLDWDLLNILNKILLNKAVLPDRMTNRENEALRYFNGLVRENYKVDKKK